MQKPKLNITVELRLTPGLNTLLGLDARVGVDMLAELARRVIGNLGYIVITVGLAVYLTVLLVSIVKALSR